MNCITEKIIIFSRIRPGAKMAFLLLTAVITQIHLVGWKLLSHFSIFPWVCTCTTRAPAQLLLEWVRCVLFHFWKLVGRESHRHYRHLCWPPLDPVAISNQLREVASPLPQPIAFTSLCDCVHACEWAGVLFVCVFTLIPWCSSWRQNDWGHLCWLFHKMQPHCYSFITNLFNCVKANVPGRDFISE